MYDRRDDDTGIDGPRTLSNRGDVQMKREGGHACICTGHVISSENPLEDEKVKGEKATIIEADR
jgi:hypothetical protein